jgi:magnesium-transporting ATPase (P-type)
MGNVKALKLRGGNPEMKLTGLTKKQVEESRQKYGKNVLTQIPPDPLWKKVLEGFKDPMIMILLVALAVQIVLFFLGETEWFEPVAIFIAIMIANGVASVSASGLIAQQVEITIEQDRIDVLNNAILKDVDAELAEVEQQLNDAQAQISDGKAELARQGMTLEALAEKLDLTIGTVSQKLNGKYPITFREAVRIKKILGVDTPLEELFKEFKEAV